MRVNFNRSKAVLASTNPNDPRGRLLFDQMMQQVPRRRLVRIGQPDVPWRVALEGEGAADAGGPGRDLFSEVCREMQSLFVNCPNGCLVPNPSKPCEYFVYVGALIAAAIISKLPQPFRFMKLVWQYIVSRRLTVSMVATTDPDYFRSLDLIKNMDIDTFASLNQKWTMTSLTGMSDINLRDVEFGSRLEYCEECESHRVNELLAPLHAIVEGVEIFFSSQFCRFLSPEEFEELACGHETASVADLRGQMHVDGLPADEDVHENMLFEVLERFTTDERMAFIKFATGRTRLPAPEQKWTSRLLVQFNTSLPNETKDNYLPFASTCLSVINIPLYSSVDIMEKRIRTALTFGSDIERDHPINTDELVSLA
jgi:hypothetical protein